MRLPDIRCRACGDLRPFEDIEVKQVPLVVEGHNIGHQNFQYCADRAECSEMATAFNGYLGEE